jgi:hypothetical protein
MGPLALLSPAAHDLDSWRWMGRCRFSAAKLDIPTLIAAVAATDAFLAP